MSNFNDALQRGLDAAKKAQANRDEIRSVFEELNLALHSMSGGKAEIVIVPLEKTLNELARLAIVFNQNRNDLVLAVSAVGRPDIRPKKIATWKQADAGYPCTLLWGERHASCDEVNSLRSELSELLSSPSVGETIFAAMNVKPIELQTQAIPPADA